MGTQTTAALPGLAVPMADDVFPNKTGSVKAGDAVDLWVRSFLARTKNWPYTLSGAAPGSPALYHIHRKVVPVISAAGIVTTLSDYEIWNGSAWVDLTHLTFTAALYYFGGGLPETTAAQFRANTADKMLSTDQVWAAAGLVALTDAGVIAVDMATFINATVTLGGNRTLGNPSNAKPGQSGLILIKQDGVGSRTLGYDTAWKFPSGTAPVLTTTASRTDKLYYFVETTAIIHAELSKDSR